MIQLNKLEPGYCVWAVLLSAIGLFTGVGYLSVGSATVHRFLFTVPWVASEYPNGMPHDNWVLIASTAFYLVLMMISLWFAADAWEEVIEQ